MVVPPVWAVGSTRRRRNRFGKLENQLSQEEKDIVEAASFATNLGIYFVSSVLVFGAIYGTIKLLEDSSNSEQKYSAPNVYSP